MIGAGLRLIPEVDRLPTVGEIACEGEVSVRSVFCHVESLEESPTAVRDWHGAPIGRLFEPERSALDAGRRDLAVHGVAPICSLVHPEQLSQLSGHSAAETEALIVRQVRGSLDADA